jgi:hypothetical protein
MIAPVGHEDFCLVLEAPEGEAVGDSVPVPLIMGPEMKRSPLFLHGIPPRGEGAPEREGAETGFLFLFENRFIERIGIHGNGPEPNIGVMMMNAVILHSRTEEINQSVHPSRNLFFSML